MTDLLITDATLLNVENRHPARRLAMKVQDDCVADVALGHTLDAAGHTRDASPGANFVVRQVTGGPSVAPPLLPVEAWAVGRI